MNPNLSSTGVLSADSFVRLFKQERASAILRTNHQEAACNAMNAAMRGGFRILEFTLSVPGALELIAEFSKKPGVVVGAGTVLTVEEVDRVVAAGAQFVVSPVMDVAVIQRAKELGVASMPGTSTPTEMLQAHRAGAPLQKLFPEVGTGPMWVKQTLGPLPFLNIVPTSGVTLANAAAYLEAGSAAVGFVNSLFVPEDIKAGAFDRIEARARAMLEAVNAPRP